MTTPADILWLDDVRWDDEGLIPAVAQDIESGKVLTLAWMNRDALYKTSQERKATYWSRSRQKLWQKGETSGHIQEVREIYLDCDMDAIVVKVVQVGSIACHTGRESCFFNRLENDQWIEAEPIIKDPTEIY